MVGLWTAIRQYYNRNTYYHDQSKNSLRIFFNKKKKQCQGLLRTRILSSCPRKPDIEVTWAFFDLQRTHSPGECSSQLALNDLARGIGSAVALLKHNYGGRGPVPLVCQQLCFLACSLHCHLVHQRHRQPAPHERLAIISHFSSRCRYLTNSHREGTEFMASGLIPPASPTFSWFCSSAKIMTFLVLNDLLSND